MAVIKLTIYVSNLSNVMGLFDKIQVWRSTTGESGVYTEITASSDVAASLLGSATGPFSLNGKTLKVKVDGAAEQTCTFVSADPIAIEDVVSELNQQLSDLTASESGGKVLLTSDRTGTVSTLEITGGTALTDLGFTSGQYDNGEDERISLVVGQSDYQYDDQSGDPDNYYKVRYYNSGTGTFSSFGDPVKGDIGTIIGPTDMIKAYCTLAKPDGKPLEGTRISFYNVYTPPLQVGDITVLGKEVEMETDQAGYAEILLVKGAVLDVTIVGTSLCRRITVPTAGTEFNLFSAIAVADDIFQIQIPDIPEAVRRS
jgi:hypothetical protein